MKPQTLGDVPVGGRAVVRRVGGARPLRCRMMELGLLPGTEVEVVRRAPLGDPLELRLRGYSLSVRRADAAAVAVELRPARVPATAMDKATAAAGPR